MKKILLLLFVFCSTLGFANVNKKAAFESKKQATTISIFDNLESSSLLGDGDEERKKRLEAEKKRKEAARKAALAKKKRLEAARKAALKKKLEEEKRRKAALLAKKKRLAAAKKAAAKKRKDALKKRKAALKKRRKNASKKKKKALEKRRKAAKKAALKKRKALAKRKRAIAARKAALKRKKAALKKRKEALKKKRKTGDKVVQEKKQDVTTATYKVYDTDSKTMYYFIGTVNPNSNEVGTVSGNEEANALIKMSNIKGMTGAWVVYNEKGEVVTSFVLTN